VFSRPLWAINFAVLRSLWIAALLAQRLGLASRAGSYPPAREASALPLLLLSRPLLLPLLPVPRP
jgi:hypothetical protein